MWECFWSLLRSQDDDRAWERVLASGQLFAADRIERFPHSRDPYMCNAETRFRRMVFAAWMTQFRVLEVLPAHASSVE